MRFQLTDSHFIVTNSKSSLTNIEMISNLKAEKELSQVMRLHVVILSVIGRLLLYFTHALHCVGG